VGTYPGEVEEGGLQQKRPLFHGSLGRFGRGAENSSRHAFYHKVGGESKSLRKNFEGRGGGGGSRSSRHISRGGYRSDYSEAFNHYHGGVEKGHSDGGVQSDGVSAVRDTSGVSPKDHGPLPQR